ncbi:TPA: hypothetical protein OUI54_003364 [Klebsiella variicola]|uniref:hypothetical protein n=1 Tax=Raoultella planticola TaxID=575 RepID=UPI001CCB269C|nr:hypothetical protein [Raoultella planticola]HCU2191484.1 hypothetical protein [Klebsiella variicola]
MKKTRAEKRSDFFLRKTGRRQRKMSAAPVFTPLMVPSGQIDVSCKDILRHCAVKAECSLSRQQRRFNMVNEFTIPDDKTFVCTFIASPDDMKEAIESCRKYLNSEEETEFSNVFMFMLYGLLKYGDTEITINAELQESLESLVDEKKSRRRKRH